MTAATQPYQPHSRIKKWQPRKWRAEYDRIVAYSVLGKRNVEIAELMGFTKEYISVILNLPEAQDLYARLKQKIKEKIETSIVDDLDYVAKKAAKRMRQAVDDDELFDKSPFAVINMGVDVLKGMNHLRGGGNGALHSDLPSMSIGQIVINNGQKSDLLEGLQKVAEVRTLHAGLNGRENGRQKETSRIQNGSKEDSE